MAVGVAGVDRGVSALLWSVLLEAEAACYAVGVMLQQFAYVTIDDLVLTIDYARLDQRLAVKLAGKEVLQVPVSQRLVQRALLQRRNPEFPALHLEFIIFYPPPTPGKRLPSREDYLSNRKD